MQVKGALGEQDDVSGLFRGCSVLCFSCVGHSVATFCSVLFCQPIFSVIVTFPSKISSGCENPLRLGCTNGTQQHSLCKGMVNH